MTSSFFDSVRELKTKFPVNEETPVFMYKFIFLAFSLDKEIFSLLLNMFINEPSDLFLPNQSREDKALSWICSITSHCSGIEPCPSPS